MKGHASCIRFNTRNCAIISTNTIALQCLISTSLPIYKSNFRFYLNLGSYCTGAVLQCQLRSNTTLLEHNSYYMRHMLHFANFFSLHYSTNAKGIPKFALRRLSRLAFMPQIKTFLRAIGSKKKLLYASSCSEVWFKYTCHS